MPYSIFITAHGDRGAGTELGANLVPPGVTIHCVTGDAVLLKGDVGMAIEDRLTLPALDVPTVQAAATKTYTAFDMIPNYTAYGAGAADPAFQFATGVSCVGTQKNDPPALALNDGASLRIADVIGRFRKLYAGLTDVYWLCCRAAPKNANNTIDVDDGAFGLIEAPAATGLRPSQVKARGSWR